MRGSRAGSISVIVKIAAREGMIMTIENQKVPETPTYNDAYFEQQASKEEIYLEETEEELRANLVSSASDSSQSSE